MEMGRIQGKATGDNPVIAFQKNKLEKDEQRENKDQKGDQSPNVINASELNLVGQQGTLKELFAKKAAWKRQEDQFIKDLKVDDNLKEHANRRDTLRKEANENQSQVNKLNQLKSDLKEAYAISDDSKEQKDLELLEKKVKGEALTQEELNQINQMEPLTEYQKASLEYTSMSKIFKDRAEEASDAAYNEDRTIGAIKLGLLKSSPMVEAKKDAEIILKQVDGEIQKAIVEELKKKVNENLDINPEDQILMDPQSFVQQKKVTEEDLKGLAVDEKV